MVAETEVGGKCDFKWASRGDFCYERTVLYPDCGGGYMAICSPQNSHKKMVHTFLKYLTFLKGDIVFL